MASQKALPVGTRVDQDPYSYLHGFNNHHTVSAIGPSALPSRGHNPLHPPHGLFTEQLSGTSFTCPRHLNARTWLYRIRPSVAHTPFHPIPSPHLFSSFTNLTDPRLSPTPSQLRWDPFPVSSDEDFVTSLRTIAGAGDTQTKSGLAIYSYGFTLGMRSGQKAFYNSDGDMLILPVTTPLDIRTEFGFLFVAPGEFCVVPRGVKFSVDASDAATGYVLETFSAMHPTLPDLGPIGANGLANPQDFCYPEPSYEDVDVQYTLLNKFLGGMYAATQAHSPFDVVAWNGNYLPYKYCLDKFCPMGSISYDHPDPSIFTVLTVPNPGTPGTALADFVLFPPRWLVAEETFRPPYFHRNVMCEFMVNVKGEYDAKEKGGFGAGGASLHGVGEAHGPDRGSWEKETARAGDGPRKVGEGSLAVMFESYMQLVTTRWAVEECGRRQEEYYKCWEGFEVKWRREKPEGA